MKTKFEKVTGITSELLSYCHQYGANEFHIDILEGDGSVSLVVSAGVGNISDEELESLRQCLSAPRQREVEQDYWELIGGMESSSELTLIGMLCDEAYVNYDGKLLTISLTRQD